MLETIKWYEVTVHIFYEMPDMSCDLAMALHLQRAGRTIIL
jgi:hypothetical protein